MRTRAKRLILAGAILAVGLAAVTSSYIVWFRGGAKAPDAATASGQSIVQFLASDGFARMPEDQKKDYFQKLRQREDRAELMRMGQNADDKQREALRKNVEPVFRQLIRDTVDGYFNTPPEQRDAYLDRVIEENKGPRMMPPPERSAATSAGASGSSDKSGKGHPRSEEQLKKFLANTEPVERARMAGFAMAMFKRMQERGKK